MTERRTVEVEPVTAQHVFNGVYSGGAHVLLCDLRPVEEYKKGFIATAVSLPPPPTSPDGHARGDSGSSLTASLSGMRRDSSKLLNFPPNLSDIEAAVHDDEIRKRLGRRALRSVILYDGNEGPKPSPWVRHLSKLFLKDGKALTVTVLQGGYRSFAERYAFAVHRDPDAPARSYPSEVLSNRLYLGNLQQALDEQVIQDLKITHVVNAANSIGRETFAAKGVQYFYVDVEDQENSDLSPHLLPMYHFIQLALCEDTQAPHPPLPPAKTQAAQPPVPHAANPTSPPPVPGCVFIHCQMGVSRSAALTIYYMMCARRWCLVKAFDHVRRARPQIFPNMGFRSQLRRAEISLFHKASVSEEALEYLGEDGGLVDSEGQGNHRPHPCSLM